MSKSDFKIITSFFSSPLFFLLYNLPALLCPLLWIGLAVEEFSCFHLNFRIVFLSAMKNVIGIFMWITLNLYNAFNNITTCTILILLIHKHRVSFSIFKFPLWRCFTSWVRIIHLKMLETWLFPWFLLFIIGDIRVFHFNPATLLKAFICSRGFLMESYSLLHIESYHLQIWISFISTFLNYTLFISLFYYSSCGFEYYIEW